MSNRQTRQPFKQLTLGFVIVLTLMAVIVGMAIFGLNRLTRDIDKIVTEHGAQSRLAVEMLQTSRDRGIMLGKIILEDDPFARDELISQFTGLARKFGAARERLLASPNMDAHSLTLLERQRQLANKVQPLQNRVIELAETGQQAEASKLLLREALPEQGRMLAELREFSERQEHFITGIVLEAERTKSHVNSLLILSGASAMVIGAIIALVVLQRMRGLIASIEFREWESRSLLETIPDLIWFKDCAGQLKWTNQAFVRATGSSVSSEDQQDKGASCWEGDGSAGYATDQHAIASGQTLKSETRIDAFGQAMFFDVSRTPLYLENGQCAGVLCVAHDISAQRRMENAIKTALHELEFQKFAMDQHAIVSIANVTGNITYINDKFCSVSGYSREELLGRNHRLLKSGQHSGAFYSEMWSTITSGQVWRGEVCNRRKDGRSYWVETTIVPFLDEHGLPHRYISIRTEITQIKQAEAALLRGKEELEHLVTARTGELREQLQAVHALNDKLKDAQNQLLQSEKMASVGQLAAGVAHEINNPIGYVYSNLGTLESYVQDLFNLVATYESIEPAIADPAALRRLHAEKNKAALKFLRDDTRALMQETREGITRVKKIVQDLKDFSRIDSSDECHWADLQKGLDSTLNIVWNELKYKAEVKKEYADIPEIACHASQLNQVFLNLLVNAGHAIEHKGVITIRTGQVGTQVWVDVEDNGKGIAPEHLKRIFDPFFTTKPVGEGTGLGLSLSYSIVQKHGGSIEVKSVVGEGTVFRVWLPIRQASTAQVVNG